MSGFAFTGREWDAETGLYYYRARYYEPQSSRFLTNDPSGFAAGTNFYRYVNNTPLRAIDPSGLDIIVIENGPTGLLSNPAGHTAVAISGHGVYSYGNSTKLGSSIQDYLNRDAPNRNTVVYVIATTLAQDQAALRAVVPPGGMGVVTDNCASRSNKILDAAGIPYPSSAIDPATPALFPSNLPGTAGARAAWSGATMYRIPQGGSIPAELLRRIK
jgi:RHS repeat-associated protein